MKNIQIKKPYVAPELTVVDFKVERGLGTSADDKSIQLNELQLGPQNLNETGEFYMGQMGYGGTYFGGGTEGTSGLGPKGTEGGYFSNPLSGGYF